jgi:hypothetical protein
MPTTIDLATLTAAQGVIVTALRDQCCQWEQDSTDAAADGRLVNALMLEHWAFAADLLAGMVSTKFAALFGEAVNAQIHWHSSIRPASEQMLDALTLEVASEQSEPQALLSA